MAPWGPCWLHAELACHNAALRSAANPGPTAVKCGFCIVSPARPSAMTGSPRPQHRSGGFAGGLPRPPEGSGGLGGQWQAAGITDLGGGHLQGREGVVAGLGALRFAVGRVASRVEGLARRRARRAHRDGGRPEEQAKRAGDLALVGGRPRRAWRKQIWQGNTRPGDAALSRMGNGYSQALYPNYRVHPSGTLEIPVVKGCVGVKNGE